MKNEYRHCLFRIGLDISRSQILECKVPVRRGARVDESSSLENCRTLTGTVGSNPTLSAILF